MHRTITTWQAYMTARLRLHFVIKHIASYCAFFRVFFSLFSFGVYLWFSIMVFSLQCSVYSVHSTCFKRWKEFDRYSGRDKQPKKHNWGTTFKKKLCISALVETLGALPAQLFLRRQHGPDNPKPWDMYCVLWRG